MNWISKNIFDERPRYSSMINKKQFKVLGDIFKLPSPSSCERFIRSYYLDHFSDKQLNIGKDCMGNASVSIGGDIKGLGILLTAHMDEVGFIVTDVDKNGFIEFKPLGGVDAGMIQGRVVDIITDSGIVKGVVGKRAIHNIVDDSIVDDVYEMYIDIGERDEKKVRSMVSVCDTVVWSGGELGKLDKHAYYARGVDDKIGVFVTMCVLDALYEKSKKSKLMNSVFGVITPNEETGIGGLVAKTATNKINPTAGIVIDTCESGDYPDSDINKIELGGGPVIEIGPIVNAPMRKFFTAAAKKLKINLQMECSDSFTGTVIDSIIGALGGVPCINVSVPVRYMHTPHVVFDIRDVDDTIKLLTYVCENLHKIDTFIP